MFLGYDSIFKGLKIRKLFGGAHEENTLVAYSRYKGRY